MLEDFHNRIGTFRIHRSWIVKKPDLVLEVLKDFLVVRGEMHFSGMSIEYVAMSDFFRAILPNQEPARYVIAVRLSPLNELEGFEVLAGDVREIVFTKESRLRLLTTMY